MKNIIKFLGTLVLVLTLSAAFAQTPPPPNNGSTGSGGGTVVGGGAPIGSGLILLSIMAGAYGFARWSKGRPEYKIID